jgi:opacity protein-like surface antigen
MSFSVSNGFMDGVSGNNNSNVAFIPAFGDLFQASVNTDWIMTVTGRIGLTSPRWDRWLLCAKGGAAWAQNEAAVTDLVTGASFSNTKISEGWVAGAGIEWAFAPGWTVRPGWYPGGRRRRTSNWTAGWASGRRTRHGDMDQGGNMPDLRSGY